MADLVATWFLWKDESLVPWETRVVVLVCYFKKKKILGTVSS